LHKQFPNKFDIVAGNGKAVKKRREKQRQPKYGKVKTLENLGNDVSQKFSDAISQGLRVFQTEDGDYNVVKESDLSTPINKKPMTRTATKRFLLDH
jgi:hypothetical protein